MYIKERNLKNYTTRIGGESSNTTGFLLTEYENTDEVYKDVYHIAEGKPGTKTFPWTGHPSCYMHFKLELKEDVGALSYGYIEFTEIMGENPCQRRCKIYPNAGKYIDYGSANNTPKGCQLYWTYLDVSSDMKTIDGYISWACWLSKCSWYVQLYDSNGNLKADTSFFDNRPPTIVRSGLRFDYEGTASAYEGITVGESRVGFGSIESNHDDKFQGYYSIDNTNFGLNAVKKEINSVSSVVILNGGKTKYGTNGVRKEQYEPKYYIDISAVIPSGLYEETPPYRFNVSNNAISSYYYELNNDSNEIVKTHNLRYEGFDGTYTKEKILASNEVGSNSEGYYYVMRGKQYLTSEDFEVDGFSAFSSTNLGTTELSMRLNTMNYE